MFECVEQLKAKSRITSLCCNNEKIFIGTSDGTIGCWDLNVAPNNFELNEIPKQHSGNVEDLCLSEDNEFLFSGGADGVIRVYKADNLTLVTTLEGHGQAVKSVRSSSNLLFSGSADRTVRVWSMKDWSCIHTLESHEKIVQALTSPINEGKGSYLFSGGNDGTIKIWDLKGGECLFNLKDDNSWIRTLAVAPFRFLLSGDNEKRIQVWDLKNLKLVKTIEETDKIKQIVTSSDCFACASEDIKIYSYQTLECVATLPEKLGVDCIQLTKHFLISTSSNSVKVWKQKKEN